MGENSTDLKLSAISSRYNRWISKLELGIELESIPQLP